MIKKISKFSSLNFAEDWQHNFEDMQCYAQPFTADDIIKVHALVFPGPKETEESYSIGYLNVINNETKEEKRINGKLTGIKCVEDGITYEIAEYVISEYIKKEGIYTVYVMDKIGRVTYVVKDENSNQNTFLLFKIISDSENTVKFRYTNRINEFDTAFQTIPYDKIEDMISENDRWGTNLISNGRSFKSSMSGLVNNIISEITAGNNTGWSTNRIDGSVITCGGYKGEMTETGLAFVVQFDKVTLFDSSGNEIIPPAAYYMNVVCNARARSGDSNFAISKYYQANNPGAAFFFIDIPKTKDGNDVSFSTQYGTSKGWFFALRVDLTDPAVTNAASIVFENLMITPVTGKTYNDIIIGDVESVKWMPTLEEISAGDPAITDSNYFDFRVEGGFLNEERSFPVDVNDFRNQRFELKQLSALPYQQKTLTIGEKSGVPYWVGEKVNLILSCSDVQINNVDHVRSDGSNPETNQITPLYPLYVYKVTVEETQHYNTILDYIKIHEEPAPIIIESWEKLISQIDTADVDYSFCICETAIDKGQVYCFLRKPGEEKNSMYLLRYDAETLTFSLEDAGYLIDHETFARVYSFTKAGNNWIIATRKNLTSIEATPVLSVYPPDFSTTIFSKLIPNNINYVVWNGLSIYVAGNNMLYKYTEINGEYIEESITATAGGNISSVAEANGVIFYALNPPNGDRVLVWSDDNGATWKQKTGIFTDDYSFVINSASYIDGYYYVSLGWIHTLYGGVMRSSDLVTWERIWTGAFSVTKVIKDVNTFYAIGSDKSIKTTDWINIEEFTTAFSFSRPPRYVMFDNFNYIVASRFGLSVISVTSEE